MCCFLSHETPFLITSWFVQEMIVENPDSQQTVNLVLNISVLYSHKSLHIKKRFTAKLILGQQIIILL